MASLAFTLLASVARGKLIVKRMTAAMMRISCIFIFIYKKIG